MEPELVAEHAGEQTAAIVEDVLAQAAATEETAKEIVEEITEAARHSALMEQFNGRFGEFEQWRDGAERRLTEMQSSLETLRGQVTETLASLAIAAVSTPEPEPMPEPEPSTQPEPLSLPENAEDGPRESPAESKPEHHKASRPKRRFW